MKRVKPAPSSPAPPVEEQPALQREEGLEGGGLADLGRPGHADSVALTTRSPVEGTRQDPAYVGGPPAFRLELLAVLAHRAAQLGHVAQLFSDGFGFIVRQKMTKPQQRHRALREPACLTKLNEINMISVV